MSAKTKEAVAKAAMTWYAWHNIPPFDVIGTKRGPVGRLFRACAANAKSKKPKGKR